MPTQHVKAPAAVLGQMYEIVAKSHSHLTEASIAVEFVDSKAYIKDRLNLGKVSKFSDAARLWMPAEQKYDFCITLCMDVWGDLLNHKQCESLLDMHLTRCQVEYEPETVVVNGKTQVVKDEYGRVEYNNTMKYADDGRPAWKVEPLDFLVLAKNIQRYGLWFDELSEIGDAVEVFGEDVVEAVNEAETVTFPTEDE